MLPAFQLQGDNIIIYVNPSSVRLVWPVDPASAQIIFDNDHKVTVAAPAKQVADMLGDALKALH